MTEEPQGNAAVAGQLERGVRPAAEACPTCGSDCNERDELIKAEREIERLRAALAKANEQAERFERGWYLRGDALEKLEQWARSYPLKVFPEPLREEWQRAAALLSEKGLSLDRMSASNLRHVINGVREIVAEGLKA
jgi:hypothetical protein